MIVVTGASGHLGHFAVGQLLAKGEKVIAAARTTEKARDLAGKGAEVRHADYEKPETLEPAFRGAEKMLLVSASEVGKRARQHRAIIDAAKKAGVRHIVYTSLTRADASPMKLATEHAETEAYLRASGIPFTILRNGWYIENYTDQLGSILQLGTLYSAAGEGKVSAATREDYAAAAVAVLTSSGHEGKIYELGGESLTLAQIAEKISAWAGRSIPHVSLPFDAYKGALLKAGLPEAFADVLADADVGLAAGALEVTSGDLEKLLGRPPTTVDQVLAKLPKP